MASLQAEKTIVHRTPSLTSGELNEKKAEDPEKVVVVAQDEDARPSEALLSKYKPLVLSGLALLMLGWWISATVLPDTRHRWYLKNIQPKNFRAF